MLTRQEAQTLLNQIAQTRNSLKEQETAANAAAAAASDTPIVSSLTVEMEVVSSADNAGTKSAATTSKAEPNGRSL